ncbi:MAG: CvpA family protein [Clostridia bacterium]|nr:CvpA family protein [Clostridia bacterium]
MGIIIDLIIIAIIVISTFLGYKKGLVGVAFKLVSSIIAIVLSLILLFPVSSYLIKNTQFDENIESRIIDTLNGTDTDVEVVNEDNSNLPKVIQEYINDSISASINQTKEAVIKDISREIAQTSIKIVSFILVIIIIKIGLIFAKAITEGLAELPIIKQFNALGGTAYGIIRGLALVYAILAIISICFANSDLATLINNSNIGKIMYNSNIILKIIF